MARSGRGSNGFLWLTVGLLIGVAATVGLYFYLTRTPAETVSPSAPTIKMQTPPLPADPEPPPAAPPVVASPAPAPQPTDPQIADDAAATGMTGPATPPPEQPTN